MGLPPGAAGASLPGAQAFIRAIRQLNRDMGIPEKLPGIRREDIPALAAHAEKEANPLYPVPGMMEAKELAVLFEKCRTE